MTNMDGPWQVAALAAEGALAALQHIRIRHVAEELNPRSGAMPLQHNAQAF